MSYGIKLHVWGDWALFSRPEMKAERVSYDVMTPSAARGILEAIYWKPEMKWEVRAIHVLRPVRFANIRRNEVEAIAVAPSDALMSGREQGWVGLAIDENRQRQQRASLVLKDVGYVIEAQVVVPMHDEGRPRLAKPEARHLDAFSRRARTGRCFHRPYFGCREFPLHFSLIEHDSDWPESTLPPAERSVDFGLMLHDLAYGTDCAGRVVESHGGTRLNVEPRFFRAVMEDGRIAVPPLVEMQS